MKTYRQRPYKRPVGMQSDCPAHSGPAVQVVMVDGSGSVEWAPGGWTKETQFTEHLLNLLLWKEFQTLLLQYKLSQNLL